MSESNQIQYHKKIFESKKSSQQQKLSSYYRLKQLGHFDIMEQNKQKDVFPKLGDSYGKILDKQGGLAKRIFPFNGPKRKPPKKSGRQ